MNLEKLKDSARKFEQKEEWRKAIDVYLKAIQQIESGAESSPDLSLYNRVGDLYLKINDTPAAVRSYERAVDLYADQGFFNNAIALCGKILRVNPGRTQTYLKLAQLHARKNVVIEAKRNLIEFLERMNALGQLDPAFQSVKEFADQFSGSQEIRLMLVELLRASSREDEAQEQLRKLAGDIEARGSLARPLPERPSETEERERSDVESPLHGRRGDLVFLDTGADLAAGHADRHAEFHVPAHPDLVEPLEELVQPLEEIEEPLPPVAMDGLEQTNQVDFSAAVEEDIPALELEGIGGETVELDDISVEEISIEATDDLDASLAEIEIAPPEVTEGLPLIEMSPSADLVELENSVADDPENPDLHRKLAEHLISQDDVMRGIEELDLALMGYERVEDWSAASEVAGRLVAVDPDDIRHHQKRVELAFRMGDRGPLLDAYLELGDALARAGAVEKAIAVFRRVQEHDPGNPHAALALAAFAVDAEAVAPPRPIPSPARPAGAPPAAAAGPAHTPPAAPAEPAAAAPPPGGV
jgi:tetratricopeptide (TPR) repeat protein